MNQCLSTDAILAIGAALEWDVAGGLRHLETCDDCRAQLETLGLTRSGFDETAPIDGAILQRISAAVRTAARTERVRAHQRARWIQVLEAFLAGMTAIVILVSSGVRIGSIGAAVLAFALGASLMAIGSIFARNIPALGGDPTHV